MSEGQTLCSSDSGCPPGRGPPRWGTPGNAGGPRRPRGRTRPAQAPRPGGSSPGRRGTLLHHTRRSNCRRRPTAPPVPPIPPIPPARPSAEEPSISRGPRGGPLGVGGWGWGGVDPRGCPPRRSPRSGASAPAAYPCIGKAGRRRWRRGHPLKPPCWSRRGGGLPRGVGSYFNRLVAFASSSRKSFRASWTSGCGASTPGVPHGVPLGCPHRRPHPGRGWRCRGSRGSRPWGWAGSKSAGVLSGRKKRSSAASSTPSFPPDPHPPTGPPPPSDPGRSLSPRPRGGGPGQRLGCLTSHSPA